MNKVEDNFEKRWKGMLEFAEVFSEFGKAIAEKFEVKLDDKNVPSAEMIEAIKQVGNEFYKLGWADCQDYTNRL